MDALEDIRLRVDCEEREACGEHRRKGIPEWRLDKKRHQLAVIYPGRSPRYQKDPRASIHASSIEERKSLIGRVGPSVLAGHYPERGVRPLVICQGD